MRRSCTSADRSDTRGSLTLQPPPPYSAALSAVSLSMRPRPPQVHVPVRIHRLADDVTVSRTTRNGATHQSVKLFVLLIRTPMGTMLTSIAS
ncbi:unnamed protein product [Arctia plantaginis]|uniref:Uncharacterized protein n=1 Tax=Arctia plantaginis TaxID=874455 RepID=A0A8S1AV19_ARCPL|nr:unnamed protein product [Arctia plantaginis]